MVAPRLLLVDDRHRPAPSAHCSAGARRLQVLTASDTCALMLAQKRHPDIIVLDIGLLGTDGFAVIRRLRSRARVAATLDRRGHGAPEEEEGLQHGVSAVPHKPVGA